MRRLKKTLFVLAVVALIFAACLYFVAKRGEVETSALRTVEQVYNGNYENAHVDAIKYLEQQAVLHGQVVRFVVLQHGTGAFATHTMVATRTIRQHGESTEEWAIYGDSVRWIRPIPPGYINEK